MSCSQRSFAQKLSKTQATEVRQNVVSCGMHTMTTDSSMYSSMVSLSEPIEPLDYEEFLSVHLNVLNHDPLKHILIFPIDDVTIKTIPRRIRTIDYITPKENISELPKHVQECVDCYTRPWNIVNYSQRQYSNSCCVRERFERNAISPIILQQEFEIDRGFASFDDASLTDQINSCSPSSRQSIASLSSISSYTDTLTPRGSWASFDLRRSVNDPLIPNLLDDIALDQMDQTNEIKRQEDRQNDLFCLYPETESENSPIERRIPAEVPIEHMGHRIIVKCLQLRLELEVEPIFASMAIYDAKEKKKLSENFYFDMNSDNLKRMLSSHIQCADPSTQSRSAIFEVSCPSNDLFLVIRLEKVLQGDIRDSVEPYIKEDKDKYREKAKQNASDFCERLGKYRMPFAWTGIYLTNVLNGDNFDGKDNNSVTLERDSRPCTGGVTLFSTVSSNSLDRKLSTSSFDQLRRKANDVSGTITRRGSLERKEKCRSWSPDDFTNLMESFRPMTITISSFFKQEADKMRDEDLYKFLLELKRPNSAMKKYKCIPGCIKLEISPCSDNVKNALTPELAKVEPYVEDTTRPIREILEFPSMTIYNPHYTYRNLLFVSPKELNFSSRTGSARNIAVRIQLMSGETQNDALKAIMGKSSCPEYSTEAFTAVNYHNKCPTFYDEIKFSLPANLKQNHHLFFTLYHVSCQKKPQEMQAAVETPIGYTWLPLLEDGNIKVGDFQLPVMVETPPENYSFIPPNVHLPGTKWLDNHRSVFSITVEAVSSVHCLDVYLDRFFLMCSYLDSRKIPARIGEGNMECEMKKCLLSISKAEREPLVKNLHLVLDKLIELLVTTYKIGGQTLSLGSTVFEVLCLVSTNLATLNDDTILDQHGRQSLLSTYVQFQCKIFHPIYSKCSTSSNYEEDKISDVKEMTNYVDRDGRIRLLHEELVLHWVVASGRAAELAMNNSWILFELIVKSMIEHLNAVGLLQAPRKQRFPHQFTDDIATLVHLVTTKVVGYHANEPKLAQSINASLGFFLFDLFSIMDRGFVFGLIKTYYKVLISKNASIPDLMGYKINVLCIVCSHEHYVALNLPFGTPYTTTLHPCSPTPSISSNHSAMSYSSSERALHADLSVDFRQQHFLVGLVLSELATVLEVPNSQLHGKAIRMIYNLMVSHDVDPRYSDKEAKARVASLYIPMLPIVMDAIPQLHQYISNSSDRLQSLGLLDDYQGPHAVIASTTISSEVAYAISGSRPYTYIRDQVKNKLSLSSENTRHLLICYIWIIKNVQKITMYRWLLGLSPHRVHQMLQVLNACIPCFEYKGQKRLPILNRNNQSFRKPSDLKEKLEECIRGTNSARHDLINRRKDRNSTEKFRWRKDQIHYRAQFYDTPLKADSEADLNSYTEGSLANECTLIILDYLEIIIQLATNSDIHHNLLGTILRVLLHALSRNQSTTALKNLFATQRSLILKFPNLLFDEETDSCADLCLLLLKHCGSQLPNIRSQAAASLYLLMRQNFEIGNENNV